MKEKKIKTGGVSLFNGIIFSSNYRQAIIQKNGNRLNCRTSNYINNNNVINKIPIIRGILGLSSQVGNATPEFISSSGEEEKVSKLKTILSYITIMIVCIGIPLILSLIVSKEKRVWLQLVIILLEVVIYLIALKNMKELDTLFMYHGAEHKAVNAYENLSEDEITVENIKKQTRFHKRCGGNFVVYFIILTLISLFVPISNLFLKAIALMILAVFNIGVAYEIVNIFSNFPKPLDILNYPATLIQYITTKEPTDEMLKLAMYGVLASIRKKDGITVSDYIKRYININLGNIDYDTQDIYSILEYVTGTDKNKLILQKDSFLIRINQEIKADELLDKYYKEKYPLQYLTHKQYFYKEIYYVDENVLIPRYDSEILVEKALEYIEKENIENIIDLCTGSGALGISIAKNSPLECNVELMDISQGALNVARKNILQNNVEDKVTIRLSNLLEEKINQIKNAIDEEKDKLKVDMIVSNPPYIKTHVINTLSEEVKKEPILALDGGKDGMDFYSRIVKEAKKVLRNNGLLIFEIGYDQLEDMKNLIKDNNEFKMLESVKDYGGNDRVVICRFQDK